MLRAPRAPRHKVAGEGRTQKDVVQSHARSAYIGEVSSEGHMQRIWHSLHMLSTYWHTGGNRQ